MCIVIVAKLILLPVENKSIKYLVLVIITNFPMTWKVIGAFFCLYLSLFWTYYPSFRKTTTCLNGQLYPKPVCTEIHSENQLIKIQADEAKIEIKEKPAKFEVDKSADFMCKLPTLKNGFYTNVSIHKYSNLWMI